MTVMDESIAKNLAAIREAVAAATAGAGAEVGSDTGAGRDPGSVVPEVVIVGVCKKQPDTRVDAALAAGLRVFGENRVAEAAARWRDSGRRAAYPDCVLHLVGALQTNKSADAVALFDVIESLDREKLARALADEIKKQGREALRFFIQVNTGEEEQKAGIPPREAVEFSRFCRDELGLAVTGFMCIPPMEEEAAMHFALLATLAREANLPHLSMGMSRDYAEAVAFGATHIRVGTALFGARG